MTLQNPWQWRINEKPVMVFRISAEGLGPSNLPSLPWPLGVSVDPQPQTSVPTPPRRLGPRLIDLP